MNIINTPTFVGKPLNGYDLFLLAKRFEIECVSLNDHAKTTIVSNQIIPLLNRFYPSQVNPCEMLLQMFTMEGDFAAAVVVEQLSRFVAANNSRKVTPDVVAKTVRAVQINQLVPDIPEVTFDIFGTPGMFSLLADRRVQETVQLMVTEAAIYPWQEGTFRLTAPNWVERRDCTLRRQFNSKVELCTPEKPLVITYVKDLFANTFMTSWWTRSELARVQQYIEDEQLVALAPAEFREHLQRVCDLLIGMYRFNLYNTMAVDPSQAYAPKALMTTGQVLAMAPYYRLPQHILETVNPTGQLRDVLQMLTSLLSTSEPIFELYR